MSLHQKMHRCEGEGTQARYKKNVYLRAGFGAYGCDLEGYLTKPWNLHNFLTRIKKTKNTGFF